MFPHFTPPGLCLCRCLCLVVLTVCVLAVHAPLSRVGGSARRDSRARQRSDYGVIIIIIITINPATHPPF